MSVQAPSARERRAIALGAAVLVAGMALAYGAVPFARRWSAREEVIASEAARLARLRGLARHEARLRAAVEARAASPGSAEPRLLSGRSPALAASALQSLLRDFADRSQVTVSRLDVAGAPESAGAGPPMIPATVSAVGDVHGLASLLSLIQHGPHLLEITELSVRPNPALRGELLQMTVTVRAAYLGG